MSMELSQATQQTQVHVPSPQLVAANHVLALSSAELQSLIYQEMDENPALDMEETATCPRCGFPLRGPTCEFCQRNATLESSGAQSVIEYGDDVAWRQQTRSDDDEFDPTTRVAAQMSLAEHLTLSLQAQFPADDAPLIEYLVGNLDEDGRLRCTSDEVEERFEATPERVEAIIRALQAMEPVGVGARDLRECLLIQLDYVVAQTGTPQPLVRAIISDYLGALSEHKYSQIALELGVSTEMVRDASDYIKRNLNPFPGRGHLDMNLSGGGETAAPVIPDVIITRKTLADGADVFEVEVIESKRFYLRVNPSYAQVYTAAKRHEAGLSDDERQHIQHYVMRARLFIANSNQRRQTLARITRCVVDLQRDFLENGVRALRPLTRAKVATELDLHESTVSRATAAKFVMLPTGEVIPFSNFFVANLSIKDVIKELVEHEQSPLTDQELADLLKCRDIKVARRTVAKYREQLSILPSTLR
ncbi:MAG TPA: RNA polymerase factor sigma-54 [Ktedonobacterales bacterium]|nr:RNA polymerase factor sigma-54 [Ktedonobacterales bacterium]